MCGLFAFAHDVTGYLGTRVRVKILSVSGSYAMCRTADRTDKGRVIPVLTSKIKIEMETQMMSDAEVHRVKSRQRSSRDTKRATNSREVT